MKILIQLGILFAVCWAGACLEAALPFAFPASVLALVLLLLALFTGLLKLPRIRETADFFTSNLGLFFIPAGVGLMNHAALIRENALALLAVLLLSLVLTFAAAAGTVNLVRRLRGRKERDA